MIDQEIEARKQQNLDQEQHKTDLFELYREKADSSLGLSPNLEIESIEKGLAEESDQQRHSSLLVVLQHS